MPINAGPEYYKAEKEYLNSHSVEDRIYWLEEMLRLAPKHKSSEKFVSELKNRLRRFREKAEKLSKKSSGKKGIRKEGFQFVLVGKANSGKSALLGALTNARSKVTEYGFGTKEPVIGTFSFSGVHAQVIDIPSLGSEFFDIGLVNTADCLLITVEKLEDIKIVEEGINRSRAKRIIVINKSDKYGGDDLRKFIERIKSKRIGGVLVSARSGLGLKELRERMFSEMGVVRVFTKEPGKVKSERPMVLKVGATVKDVAEMILKGFSNKVKETRLTGPSGKFKNQRVGLKHRVKDLDVIEFHTR
jgi:uncharacterized protein